MDKNNFENLSNFINKIAYFIAILLLIIGFIAMVLQVFGRSTDLFPIYWQEELARLCFVGVAVFASVIVVSKDEHLKITIFLDKFPKHIKTIILVIMQILAIIFFVFLAYQSYSTALFNLNRKTPALRISFGIVYFAIAISCLLMLMQSVINIIRLIRNRKIYILKKEEINS